jgi:predicted transcriptional regulator
MSFSRRKGTTGITAEIACQIVRMSGDGMTNEEIANQLGYARTTVSGIVNHRTWFNETIEARREVLKRKAVN